jgi:hypothetical protein
MALFADRTSAAAMRTNQLRLSPASMAYVLICALRRIGLKHTEFAKASCGKIRLKLLKIGALIKISVRRIKVAMASGLPIKANSAPPTPYSWRRHATNQTAHSDILIPARASHA